MTEQTTKLPWGMNTYNAIQTALYFLDGGDVPLSEEARKLHAIDILRGITAPTPADCGKEDQDGQ